MQVTVRSSSSGEEWGGSERWHTCVLTCTPPPPPGQGSPGGLTSGWRRSALQCPPSWVVGGTVGAGARNAPDGHLSLPDLRAGGELLASGRLSSEQGPGSAASRLGWVSVFVGNSHLRCSSGCQRLLGSYMGVSPGLEEKTALTSSFRSHLALNPCLGEMCPFSQNGAEGRPSWL